MVEIAPALAQNEKHLAAELELETELEKDATHFNEGAVEHKGDVTYEAAARAEDFEHSLGLWASIKIFKVVSRSGHQSEQPRWLMSVFRPSSGRL